MAKIAANQAAVDNLRALGTGLLSTLDMINQTADNMKNKCAGEGKEIVHAEEFDELYEEILTTNAGVVTSTASIAAKVNTLASKLEALLSKKLGK